MERHWLDLAAELMQVADERGDVDYLEVVTGDLSIRFGRGDGRAVEAVPAARPAAPAAPAVPAPERAASPPVAPEPVHEVAGTVLVRSPMVGLFYRASAPGKPAFVEVGDEVDAEVTMGLVEAMKVFTSIRADVQGKVEQVLCGDNEFVEFDQPLFRVRVA